MPRRLTPFVASGYYHINNRGNNRGPIFFQPENYLYFLRGMKRYLLPAADVLAYCLMPTHYHLMVSVKQTSEVLETSEVSSQISSAMMKLSVSYTKAINKRFARVGVLFQGPFQARPITDSNHLLHLCRYIHANPVKDGLVSGPADWPYSNYLEWIGERDGSLIDIGFVRAQFPDPGGYQDFVADYVRTPNMPQAVMRYVAALEG